MHVLGTGAREGLQNSLMLIRKAQRVLNFKENLKEDKL